MNRKAVIFGATGLIGEHLVKELLLNGNYEVTCCLRKPGNQFIPNIKRVIIDFDKLEVDNNLLNI